MKQATIYNAYISLMKVSNFNLPIKKSYQIYKLMKSLEETYNFIKREKEKVIVRYADDVLPNGLIQFDNEQNYKEYLRLIGEIDNLDTDITIDNPIILSIGDCRGETFTAADIDNLQGFIIFEEVE